MGDLLLYIANVASKSDLTLSDIAAANLAKVRERWATDRSEPLSFDADLPLAAPTVAIMEFLKSHEQITNRHARDITGIKSENLVKIEFYKLRDEGHIERVPELAGPKSAWRLTDKGKDFLSGAMKA